MRRLILFWAALAAAGGELLFQWVRIWNLAPDLAWGWVLPPLIGYFIWSRWVDRPPRCEPGHGALAMGFTVAALAGALLLLPFSRLLLEPFPGWPLAEWMHSVVVIGLILALIAAHEGAPRARHFAWPLLFGLVALPWPAFIAVGVMGNVRIGLSALVTEALNFMGEPATSTGTVIQVARGSIGIDEACGGIRSLQAAIMVALAIGELRRDSGARRLIWLGIGTGLALAANLLRIGALALICSRAGTAVMEAWHDRVAGLEMALVLGGLAILALRAGVPPPPARPATAGTQPVEPQRQSVRMAIFVVGIVALTEAGTLVWFGMGAARFRSAAHWSAHLPVWLPSYSEDAFSPVMQDLLKCDSHQLGHWLDASGGRCAGYVIEWHSGHAAQYAVRLHNPDICLDLAGSELVRSAPIENITLGSFDLPFSVREFRRGIETYYVYFLAWNISAGKPLEISATANETSASWFRHQWAEVLAGRRQLEARLMALAVYDAESPAEADRVFRAQIARILASK